MSEPTLLAAAPDVSRDVRAEALQVARDHVAKAALSMIDWANHKPENRALKPKVGGHQASSMSAVDILCALYLDALRPGDRVAVKPHAAPVLYGLAHAFGLMTRAELGRLREYKGPQPYPTELKNPLFVDYTTSSEALGAACTIYDAYGAKHANRALATRLGRAPVTATYWAHVGDGELTEGQIDESLYDAGRWRLDNLVWIVDLNRQSLDRVMDDSGQLGKWVRAKFEGQAWQVVEARWGARAEALFAHPEGGAELRAVLERMDDALLHPLLMIDGATLKAVLAGETAHTDPAMARLLAFYRQYWQVGDGERAGLRALVQDVSDATLAAGIGHLGGHDLGLLGRLYAGARAADGPVCIVAHTVKGYQTSAVGHPENHGGLIPTTEVVLWGTERGLPRDEPYPLPASGTPASELFRHRAAALYPTELHQYEGAPIDVRAALGTVPFRARTMVSTGEAFQSLNLALLKTEAGPYLQFGAPDVGQTTHLGPIIKQTGVFAPRDLPDMFGWMREGPPAREGERDAGRGAASRLAFDWRPEPTGQFHAFGIAEGNVMLWAYAFGRRKKRLEGKSPLLTVVTVYDKFFERGFNQIDYAVYSNARFVAVGTPSGTGLSRETATHQSIQTPRMMMDLPGIVAYEPAFAADVHAIYLQALGQLWDADGEATYLRLSTQVLEQPAELPADHAAQAVAGAYWLVGEDVRVAAPGKATVLLVGTGRKLREVRQAAKALHAEGIGSRILNVTSYEKLWRDWDRAVSAGFEGAGASYTLHELFSEAELNLPMVIVGDFVPSVAEWLPGALQRVRGARFLGPRTNGEAGDIASIDHLHGMATEDIVRVAKAEIAWRQRG